jgi:hypothetical protein|tara:strand:+ start:235 stop:345 length:111 start_codon:yes stop_codon:yes gene_type:complete
VVAVEEETLVVAVVLVVIGQMCLDLLETTQHQWHFQ